MRREIILSEDDVECLDAMGLEWETMRNGSAWLLLHQFEFPEGYNHRSGSVAIQIPNNYPMAPLDMAYFYPPLARLDAKPLRQTQVFQQIEGKQWQRWSRHYSWIIGQHNISTHIVLIRNWLKAALEGN